MQRLGPIGRGIAIATLMCFAAPQAEAIELYGAKTAAEQLDDSPLVLVRAGRGGGGMRHGGGGMHRGGGMHHGGGGMHRGGGMHHGGGMRHGGMHHGMNRGAYAHRGNIHGGNRYDHRNVNRNVNRNVYRYGNRNVYRAGHGGAWSRPGGYWWPVGGAVAAGAALGFVSAAAATSWAGAAPGPNLCWYYTDSSRRAGFWDACP